MLLKSLEVTNRRGSVLGLPLEDISNGFVVKEIEGLAPVKATLVSSSFANMDGAQYHSSRREPRNIILKLGLSPDYAVKSVQDLRSQLYDFFMPKTEATLTFRMFDKFTTSVLEQTLDLQINARIESFELTLFTKEPEVNISLMCFNPDLYDPIPVIFEGVTTPDLNEVVLPYKGTVETGVLLTIRPTRYVPEFTIYHRPPDDTFRTTYFTMPLLAGDVLAISSVFGDKSVVLTRAAVNSHVLYALSPESNWIELIPGNNNFRVSAAGDPVPYTIEYTNKYGGL